MELSSTLCRAQEVIQRDRAASATLENVRIIAGKAAAAWGVEAIAAERREARHARSRAIAKLVEIRTRHSQEDHEAMLSENPDRDFA